MYGQQALFKGPMDNPNYPRIRGTEAAGMQFTEDFYVYPVKLGTFTASANVTQTITIQADSDFEWLQSTCYGNEDGATVPISDSSLIPIILQIQDGGSGRNLFNQQVPIGSIAGLGKLPYYLPVPRVFIAKSTVTFTATSIDAANQWDNIYFNLIGRKIFWVGGRPNNFRY